MAVHVTCPQCKKQVPFGKLFCVYCGAKLELTPDRISRSMNAGEIFGGLKKWIIRLISLSVFAVIIGVFIWPLPPQGQAGGPAQAAACEQRLAAAHARTLNGIVFTETFPEDEANAWLKDKVAHLANAGAGAGFVLSEVNLAFRPGRIIVNTRMTLSKINISYEIELKPVISPRGFEYTLESVRVGHVPMPEFTREFFAGRALHVFSELRNEDDLLKRMKQLDVIDRQVRVSNQGR